VIDIMRIRNAYIFTAVCPFTGATKAMAGLRQNELANRCFSCYQDIVNECSRAWNSFISDVNRVKDMCMRDWIKVIN
jgi:hypothetical protein